MNALLRKAIPGHKLHEMQYTGNGLTAEECERHHIVSGAYHRDELMEKAIEFAKGMKKGKKRGCLQVLRKRENGRCILQGKPHCHRWDELPPRSV